MPHSPFAQHMAPYYVIAEASGNHCQDLRIAHQLVDAAAHAGAHAVKFQTFTAEEIAAPAIPILTGYDAEHDAWIRGLGVTTLQQLFTLGGLPRAWHAELHRHATDVGLDFLSTPFSVDAARFLVEDVGVPSVKIASGDLTYAPLLHYMDSVGVPVILSTGGATGGEVSMAVRALRRTYEAGRLALLHCRSVYPCEQLDVNLRAITWIAKSFPLAVPGWSDHTTQIDTPAYALCVGAIIIEKHLTIAASTGIDAGHSLTPDAFKVMMATLQQMSTLLGDVTKKPLDAERHDRLWARRSSVDWLRPTEEARHGIWAEGDCH